MFLEERTSSEIIVMRLIKSNSHQQRSSKSSVFDTEYLQLTCVDSIECPTFHESLEDIVMDALQLFRDYEAAILEGKERRRKNKKV